MHTSFHVHIKLFCAQTHFVSKIKRKGDGKNTQPNQVKSYSAQLKLNISV